MKANNTIQINGKLYDARTGELLNSTTKSSAKKAKDSPAPTPATSSKPTQLAHGNGKIDGFSRHPKAKHTPAPTPKTTAKKAAPAQKPQQTAAARSTSPAKRHLKHSATLHRSSVKTPHIEAPAEAKSTKLEHKSSSPSSDRRRRALSSPQSSAISKFGGHATSGHSKPASKGERSANLSIANIAKAAEKAHKSHQPQSKHHELIAKTLAEANPHTHYKKHTVKKQRKSWYLASGVAVAVVLALYVAYLNVPTLSMKVASSRAGFAATLPGKTPSGYSLRGPIAYSPGQVVINFASNTDGRRFSIQQQPTTWDTAALKENYVARQTSGDPLTYQDSGLTVFLLGGGDAAWVNDGKFYTIKASNSQLDTKQVLDIATSM
ncbi:hypothetical protein KC973_00805 [Candidatus Saccharibacteria bacterium]|nr:hypothetical protein [Candidatus Saccharibacteria bacterium]